MSSQPLPRTTLTSIKDFDIIKPISKGAFGSVFLAKKKVTGDYYALPEEWTRGYIAEVVLGLEYLHQRGIVHRYLHEIS